MRPLLKIIMGSIDQSFPKPYPFFMASYWISIVALILSGILLSPIDLLAESSSLKDLESLSLNEFDKDRQSRNEKKALRIMKELFPNPEATLQNFDEFLKWLKKPFLYSLPVLQEANNIMKQALPQLNQKQVDELVKWYFLLEERIAQDRLQKKENGQGKGHNITIWDYASEQEVATFIQELNRTICSKKEGHSKRSGDYFLVTHGTSENNFKDKRQRLQCLH